MTFLEAELALVILGLAVLAFFVWRAGRDFTARILDREKALDRHAKAVAREPLSVLREAQKAVEQSNALREDARLLHEQVDRKLAELNRG